MKNRVFAALVLLFAVALPGTAVADDPGWPREIVVDGYKVTMFQPQPEIPRDFYAEKPIKIRLSGGYHEIANFVSGVAALPRIVTLHDINITPEGNDAFDSLSLEVTAKTYRYLEDTEE